MTKIIGDHLKFGLCQLKFVLRIFLWAAIKQSTNRDTFQVMLIIHTSPHGVNPVTSINSEYNTVERNETVNIERDRYRINYIGYNKPANTLSLSQPPIHFELKIVHGYTKMIGL